MEPSALEIKAPFLLTLKTTKGNLCVLTHHLVCKLDTLHHTVISLGYILLLEFTPKCEILNGIKIIITAN
jgi:hypothetical protein